VPRFFADLWRDVIAGSYVPLHDEFGFVPMSWEPDFSMGQASALLVHDKDSWLSDNAEVTETIDALVEEVPVFVFAFGTFAMFSCLDCHVPPHAYNHTIVGYLALWPRERDDWTRAPVVLILPERYPYVIDIVYASIADFFLHVWIWNRDNARDDTSRAYAERNLKDTRQWLSRRGLASTLRAGDIVARTHDARRADQGAIFDWIDGTPRLASCAIENLYLLWSRDPERWTTLLTERAGRLTTAAKRVLEENVSDDETRDAANDLINAFAQVPRS